jgi:hypothetical protein
MFMSKYVKPSDRKEKLKQISFLENLNCNRPQSIIRNRALSESLVRGFLIASYSLYTCQDRLWMEDVRSMILW